VSVFFLFAVLGCTGQDAPTPTSRVEGAAPPPVTQQRIEAFCDQRAGAAEARPFVVPPTTPEVPPATGWRWVNVWATWCGPCVAEMPTLAKWAKKLKADGVDAQLLFLSVDKTDADVSRFLEHHPGYPSGVRLDPFDRLAPWLEQVGMASDTAIPLHFFVDPQGRTRCARASAVDAADYPIVKAILTQ
jgi:thiol-disulfide isomerase/thioredoxin